MPGHAAFRDVLRGMVEHPQGHHGWTTFFAALELAADSPSTATSRLVTRCWQARPELSASHLATLLGVAVKELSRREPGAAAALDPGLDPHQRAVQLDGLLIERPDDIETMLLGRHHSFTGTRRFLVPQLLIAHFAAATNLDRVRLLDLGTGLGLLPRQLNNPVLFERFIVDLHWPDRPLGYLPIPFGCRHAVDRAPLPTIDWVRACHGPSDYYDARLRELEQCVQEVEAAGGQVDISELDLLDEVELRRRLTAGRYDVVTCSFVLYQYEPSISRSIREAVVDTLPSSGMFISMEPDPGLARSGCRVELYFPAAPTALHFADVSDGHFLGRLAPGAGYEAVIERLLNG